MNVKNRVISATIGPILTKFDMVMQLGPLDQSADKIYTWQTAVILKTAISQNYYRYYTATTFV